MFLAQRPGDHRGARARIEGSEFCEVFKFDKVPKLLGGNPLGVLVTCERDPRASPTFSRLVDLLFKPYVQIFYYRRA